MRPLLAALIALDAVAPAQRAAASRWLLLAAVGLAAVYLVWATVRCALRLLGLVLLGALAWVVWSRLA